MSSPDLLDVQKVIDRADVSVVQKKALAVCLALGLVDGIASVMVGFVIPAISRAWQVGPADLTLLALAAPISIAVGALVLAPLADVVGRRPFILVGAAVLGVFTLAAAAAPNLPVLAVTLAVAGLAYGAVPATVYAYASEMAPARMRGTVVSAIGSGLTAGGVLCGVAAGFLVPVWGWRSLFVLGGVLALVVAVWAVRSLPETLQFLVLKGRSSQALDRIRDIDPTSTVGENATFVAPDGPRESSRFRSLFSERRGAVTVGFWVLYLCQYMAALFIFTWLPSVLTTAGVEAATALFAAAAFPLGGVVGGVLLGMLVDRVARRFVVLAAGFAVGISGILASAFLTDVVPILVVALFAAGFGVAGPGAVFNPLVAGLYPARIRTTAIGWANGVGRIGMVIGPALGGLLIGAGLPARSIFLAATAPVAVGLVCALVMSLAAPGVQPELGVRAVEPDGAPR